MLEQLLLHIQRHELCKTTDKILLAVSGGVDSMVMLDLFRKAGFAIGVAHCNFQLRGNDSVADEELVMRSTAAAGIPFHTRRFDMEPFTKKGLSIQLAARQLRYDFFRELSDNHGYDLVATAHHLNDSIETLFLNLLRGTGIQGLTGIPVKNDRIIRPLLFATRDQILNYAKENTVAWRDDRSNSEDDYQRNFIRHNISPLLTTLNPSFESTLQKTIERISGAAEMTQQYLEKFKATSIEQSEQDVRINVSELKKNRHAAVFLWELLKSKGFNYDQCVDIVMTAQPGKQFLTSSHRLLVDRGYYIVTQQNPNEIPEVLIESHQYVVSNGRQTLQLVKYTTPLPNISHDAAVAQLDTASLTFPLRWRKWHAGDSFRPLGMTGHKKLSDFFIDQKISVADKEMITVVESGNTIVWVVGIRISDEVKITGSTSAWMEIKAVKSEGEKIL